MSYVLKTNYADKSNYGSYRSASKIKYIVWHYTSNDGDTDESNAKWFKTPNRNSSAHYFVDDDSVTISVPDTYVAWSVGGSRYSNYKTTGGASLYKICTNTNSINIELCDTVKNGKYNVSEKTLENAISLTRELMKKYNIPISNVVRHFDVTGKSCPAYYVDNVKWKKVKEKISEKITTVSSNTSSTLTKYSQTQFIKDIQSAIGVTSTGTPNSKTLSNLPTISKSKNSTHKVVKPLQKYLNTLGYDCGTVDGEFGSKTDSAVKSFQKKKKLTEDGVVGQNTWKKLLGV